MAATNSTTFVDKTTLVPTAWFNDVNDFLFDQLVNVKLFGATGDGSTDDTTAIQNAANYAMTIRGTLYFPANGSSSYKITSPITFSSTVNIRGSGVNGTTIMATGFTGGQFVFDFDCLAANVVEQIRIEGLTLRSNNNTPNALRLKNTSLTLVKDVCFYNVANGVYLEGTRCFSNTFENLTTVGITTSSVRFNNSFTGGGHFTFIGCTFLGSTAVAIPTGSAVDTLNFHACNFEQATTNGLFIGGLCAGLSLVSCRFEGGDSIDVNLRPFTASEYVEGIVITGCDFSASDSASSTRIQMGGDSGKVRSFNISGNIVTHGSDTYGAKFITLNGEGESGVISGNFIRGTTGAGAGVVNSQRAGVIVFGNENLTGKLAEWWGTATWGVTVGTATLTATGMTTSPTGTLKYTITGSAVTLDIPGISGTSNATTFTLTGAPATIAPVADKDVICIIRDNSGTATSGLMRIKTSGVIELYASVAGAAFTAAGTKAVNTVSVSYTLS
jgi:hypothetical protein